jgi:hypothetical protein
MSPKLLISAFSLFGVALLLFAATACTEMFYSDSANANRQGNRARQEAVRSMKISSAEAPAARLLSGEELVSLLAGKSHISEYRKRARDPKPYFTIYDYFGADGSYIGRDTYARRTTDYQHVGRWAVNGTSLCIAASEEHCYSIRLEDNGAIQYWVNEPGNQFDGLITRVVTIVRTGLQQPEYVSDPSAFR